MNKLLNKKIYLIYGVIIIFIIFLIIIYVLFNKEDKNFEIENDMNLVNINNEVGVEEKNNENKICVHIIGAVVNEGIVELNEGDRIINAIEKAGGVSEDADISKVNLAYVLSDGQKIKIPDKNNNEENFQYIISDDENSIIVDGNNGVGNNSKININSANQTELETLNGVGPSIAAKIIEYRNKNGKFKNVDELRNVSGIGENKMELIRESVRVK